MSHGEVRNFLFAATSIVVLVTDARAWAQQVAAEPVVTDTSNALSAGASPQALLESRVQALEEELKTLHAQIADMKTTAAAQLKDTQIQAAAQPAVSLPNGRPSFASADGDFSANFHAVLQLDTANYFQRSPGPLSADFRRGATPGDTAHARDLNSGTNFRRARIGVDGKVFSAFEYSFIYEFGGSGSEDAGRVYEAFLQYNGLAPFHLKAGSFIPLQGLEDSNSTNGMPFLERPTPADVTRLLAGGDSRTAIQLFAYGPRWLASGAITGAAPGTINSTGSSTPQPFDEQLGIIGRTAFTPFKGEDWRVHVGVNGSYVARIADSLGPDAGAGRYVVQFRERPELRVDGTRLIDTGPIDAAHAYTAGLELAVQKRNFYAQGEFYRFGLERGNGLLSDPDFSAFYVEGSWILTGESRRYNVSNATFDSPTVAHPVDGKGGWGAFELAFRYSDTDLNYQEGFAGSPNPPDRVRGGKQRISTAGLNWYLNPSVRLMLDVQRVQIDRLSPNATTFATPVGAQIGQTYSAAAGRIQLAY